MRAAYSVADIRAAEAAAMSLLPLQRKLSGVNPGACDWRSGLRGSWREKTTIVCVPNETT